MEAFFKNRVGVRTVRRIGAKGLPEFDRSKPPGKGGSMNVKTQLKAGKRKLRA
jgi:hypothetical protein